MCYMNHGSVKLPFFCFGWGVLLGPILICCILTNNIYSLMAWHLDVITTHITLMPTDICRPYIKNGWNHLDLSYGGRCVVDLVSYVWHISQITVPIATLLAYPWTALDEYQRTWFHNVFTNNRVMNIEQNFHWIPNENKKGIWVLDILRNPQ